MEIHTYKDLIVWQKSMKLVTEIYKITEGFPRAELFGIVSQMRRAAVSIPSNIAEGREGRLRGHRKEFKQFLLTAYGSGGELETQIEIAKRLLFLGATEAEQMDSLLEEVMKMLNSMINKLAR